MLLQSIIPRSHKFQNSHNNMHSTSTRFEALCQIMKIKERFRAKYVQGPAQWLSGKESACRCRRHGLHPWVRKNPWRKNGNPLQYSCLENSKNRGVWQAVVNGVTESGAQLKRLSSRAARESITFKNTLPPQIPTTVLQKDTLTLHDFKTCQTTTS